MGNRKLICLIILAALTLNSCDKGRDAIQPASGKAVPLCDILKHPDLYDGKKITVSATIQGDSAKYLYSSNPCGDELNATFVRLEGGGIQHSGLREIEAYSSKGPKEFDLEVTGIFDSNYNEGFKGQHFRIKAIGIRQTSAVRIALPRSVT